MLILNAIHCTWCEPSRTYVILAQNGPAIYTTWTVIASLLNLIHALHYVGEADMFTWSVGTVLQDYRYTGDLKSTFLYFSCMISLSLLLTILVIWFVLENTILDRFVRFIVTPYLGNHSSLEVLVNDLYTELNVLLTRSGHLGQRWHNERQGFGPRCSG